MFKYLSPSQWSKLLLNQYAILLEKLPSKSHFPSHFFPRETTCEDTTETIKQHEPEISVSQDFKTEISTIVNNSPCQIIA